MSVGLDLPSTGGGTEAGGNCLSQRRNNAESETVDPRRPKWNENQTVLPQPYVPQTGRRAFWKAQRLGAGKAVQKEDSGGLQRVLLKFSDKY